MAMPVFAPPHPVAIFRVLKQAWREYLASGNAAGIDVTTPPAQTVTEPTVVAGTVYVDASAVMPPQVTVQLKVGAAVTATQSANVVPGTGAYTTTFPPGSLAEGANCTATVTSAVPAATAVSNAFAVSPAP
jgi:hypothetical protein